ncbi:hypothetical protein N431DRAFT_69867 [Stipitochalara longipes BDJ]|nr:hypothetical protein N431DRAFT_69867 [Stipitochalara longipes BDJ]
MRKDRRRPHQSQINCPVHRNHLCPSTSAPSGHLTCYRDSASISHRRHAAIADVDKFSEVIHQAATAPRQPGHRASETQHDTNRNIFPPTLLNPYSSPITHLRRPIRPRCPFLRLLVTTKCSLSVPADLQSPMPRKLPVLSRNLPPTVALRAAKAARSHDVFHKEKKAFAPA